MTQEQLDRIDEINARLKAEKLARALGRMKKGKKPRTRPLKDYSQLIQDFMKEIPGIPRYRITEQGIVIDMSMRKAVRYLIDGHAELSLQVRYNSVHGNGSNAHKNFLLDMRPIYRQIFNKELPADHAIAAEAAVTGKLSLDDLRKVEHIHALQLVSPTQVLSFQYLVDINKQLMEYIDSTGVNSSEVIAEINSVCTPGRPKKITKDLEPNSTE